MAAMPLKTQTYSRPQSPSNTRAVKEPMRGPVRVAQPGNPAMLMAKTAGSPGTLSAQEIMQLQRVAGNRAAQRVLAENNSLPGGETQKKIKKTGQAPDVKTAGKGYILSGQPAIQRRVGFEFQTDVRLSEYFRINNIPYGFQVFKPVSGDWKVVNDNKDMEFVTEPFEETENGKDKLTKSIQEMHYFLSDMVNATQKNKFPKVKDSVKNVKGSTYADGIWDIYIDAPSPLNFKKIQARPQASGGVTLDKIPSFINKVVTTKVEALKNNAFFNENNPATKRIKELSKSKKETIIAYEKYSQQKIGEMPYSLIDDLAGAVQLIGAQIYAESAVNNHILSAYTKKNIQVPKHGFQKLKGFLTFVIYYLITAGNLKFKYSKAAFTLMSRTNFKTMHDSLTKEEKEWFTTKNVLAAARMTGEENDAVFKSGFGQKDDIQYGPTKSEWLESIRKGVIIDNNPVFADLLSKSSQSPVVAGYSGSSSSMGALNELDKSLNKIKELAVFEIRALPYPILTEHWQPMAETVFNMMKAINNPDKMNVSDLLKLNIKK